MEDQSKTDETTGEVRVQTAQAKAPRKLAGAARAAKARRDAAVGALVTDDPRVKPDPEASAGGATADEGGCEGEDPLKAICGKLDEILTRLHAVEKSLAELRECCEEEEPPPGEEPDLGPGPMPDSLPERLLPAPPPHPVELHLPLNSANLEALKQMRALLDAARREK